MDLYEHDPLEPAQDPQPEAVPQAAPGPVTEPVSPAPEPVNADPGPVNADPEPVSANPEPVSAAPEPPQDPPAPRPRSPYADSPYVMDSAPHPGFTYQPQTRPPEKPKKPRRGGKGRTVLAAVLTVALVAGSCLITAAAVNSRWEERSARTDAAMRELTQRLEELESAEANAPVASASAEGLTPTQLYQDNVDCVVAISSTVQTSGYFGSSTGTSSGSGFVLTQDGYVVTNYHVVEDAQDVRVVLHDGTEYAAQVVGSDSANDIAVLKVDAQGLSPAAIGSSADLRIGDMVVAIGNPLGTLTATQTVGYVSGVNREVTTDNTIISMLQTDCAINPGNSGGPLFNMNGEVVGITTAKYSGTTDSGASIEGIGFAIPIDDVMGAISDLMDYGYVTGAYLGVSVTNTDADSAAMFGIPTGAYVVEVVEGCSAHRAGIQLKDIIIDLGGHTVSNVTDLTRALRNFSAGDETTITVIRGGQELTLAITLDEKPQQTEQSQPQTDPQLPSEGDYDEWYEFFRRYFGE